MRRLSLKNHVLFFCILLFLIFSTTIYAKEISFHKALHIGCAGACMSYDEVTSEYGDLNKSELANKLSAYKKALKEEYFSDNDQYWNKFAKPAFDGCAELRRNGYSSDVHEKIPNLDDEVTSSLFSEFLKGANANKIKQMLKEALKNTK